MREPDFDRLQADLLKQGIAPRHAERAAREMRDHYEDLVDAYAAEGRSDAGAAALQSLGTFDDLVAEMSQRRELKTWAWRYPYAAVLFYPLACLAALPARPVIAGVENAPALARWGTSLVAAGVFTAVLFLVLQLVILFG